jgi:hypothetical protein
MRPWDISAWYGVYAVYQPGLFKIPVIIAEGTFVPWYPWPRKHFAGAFALRSASNFARASDSGNPGISTGSSRSTDFGNTWLMRSATEVHPTVFNISSTSVAVGPT